MVEIDVSRRRGCPGTAGGSGRSRWSPERGQSMAEMALVLPLFLLLVFGIVEIGRAFAARQALTSAAREGARILVLPFGPGLPYTTEGAVQAAALNRARAYLSSSGVSVGQETEIRRVRLLPGERVGLQITHQFQTPLPMVVRIVGDQGGEAPNGSAVIIRLQAASYMAHE
jgi:hypothetical protein